MAYDRSGQVMSDHVKCHEIVTNIYDDLTMICDHLRSMSLFIIKTSLSMNTRDHQLLVIFDDQKIMISVVICHMMTDHDIL